MIRSRIAASRCATLRGLRVRDVDVECEIKITFLGKYAVVSNESELRNDSVHAALALGDRVNEPVVAIAGGGHGIARHLNILRF